MVSDILFGAVMGIGQSLSAKRDFEREIFKQDQEKAARMEELREEYRLSGENALALQKAQQETERLKQEAQTAEEMNQHRSYLSMVFPDATEEEIDALSLRVRSAGLSTSSLMNAPNAYSLLNSMLEDQRAGTRRATAAPPRTPVNVSPLAEEGGQSPGPDQVDWPAVDAELEASQGAGAAPMPEELSEPLAKPTIPTVDVVSILPDFKSLYGKAEQTATGVTEGTYYSTTGPGKKGFRLGEKESADLMGAIATMKENILDSEENYGTYYNAFPKLHSIIARGPKDLRGKLQLELPKEAKQEAVSLLDDVITPFQIRKNSKYSRELGAWVLRGAKVPQQGDVHQLGALMNILRTQRGTLSSKDYDMVAKLAAEKIESIGGPGTLTNATHADLYDNVLLRGLNEKYGDGSDAYGVAILDPETDTVFDRILIAAGREKLASNVSQGFNEFKRGKQDAAIGNTALEMLPAVIAAVDTSDSDKYWKTLFREAQAYSSLTEENIQQLASGAANLPFRPDEQKKIAVVALDAKKAVASTTRSLGENKAGRLYATRDTERGEGVYAVFNDDGKVVAYWKKKPPRPLMGITFVGERAPQRNPYEVSSSLSPQERVQMLRKAEAEND